MTINPAASLEALNAYLKMNFIGTGGTDVVRATIGSDTPTAAMTHLNANLALSLIGVGGRDSLEGAYQNVEIDGAQTLKCLDDSMFRLAFHNVLLHAPLAVAFNGTGGRGTDPGSTVGIQDVEQNPVPLDGALLMTDRGGPFADDIRVIYDFNPQPEPPSPPPVWGCFSGPGIRPWTPSIRPRTPAPTRPTSAERRKPSPRRGRRPWPARPGRPTGWRRLANCWGNARRSTGTE